MNSTTQPKVIESEHYFIRVHENHLIEWTVKADCTIDAQELLECKKLIDQLSAGKKICILAMAYEAYLF